MPAARFVEQLNAQIGNELAAHNQYLACAVHYDAETMPQMAAFFYGQALEERDHAMMMVQYLLDTDADVTIPGVEAPRHAFADVVAPVALALDQEKRVTEQINGLLRIAREESDFASEQFMQWFIKEQVEEVATMTDLLAVVTRNQDDLEDIEECVARESGGEGADPTAPRVAGAWSCASDSCHGQGDRRRRGRAWGCPARCGCSRPATGSTSSPATCRGRRPRRWRRPSGTPTSPAQDRVLGWARASYDAFARSRRGPRQRRGDAPASRWSRASATEVPWWATPCPTCTRRTTCPPATTAAGLHRARGRDARLPRLAGRPGPAAAARSPG